MLELNRTVRMAVPIFGISHEDSHEDQESHVPHEASTGSVRMPSSAGIQSLMESPRHNTFAAWPAASGLSLYMECKLTCEGEIDPETGFFMNIRELDQHVRAVVLPEMCELIQNKRQSFSHLAGCLKVCCGKLTERLTGHFRHLAINLSPFLEIGMSTDMNQVHLKQMYEFSASHRLHSDQLGDEENRAIFGKCNHVSGHGHNYELQVGLAYPADKTSHINVAKLDQVVYDTVIMAFDHKHLNEDCPEFKGVNPTVENISVVIYDMLKGPIQDQLACELSEVTVWETGKTSCTYRG